MMLENKHELCSIAIYWSLTSHTTSTVSFRFHIALEKTQAQHARITHPSTSSDSGKIGRAARSKPRGRPSLCLMTALAMLIELILPIAAIRAALSLTMKDLGASLVGLGVAKEVSLTTKGLSAHCAHWARGNRLCDGERSGIGVERGWKFDGRSPRGVKAVCWKRAVVASAVGVGGKRTHHGE